MKGKITILSLVVFFAACTKGSVVYDVPDTSIGVYPVASVSTKGLGAMLPDPGYSPDETFAVWAYHDPVSEGAGWTSSTFQSEYFGAAEFARNSTGFWAGRTAPYYWPKSGSLLFAALSPYSVLDAPSDSGEGVSSAGSVSVAYDPAVPGFTVTGFTQGTYSATLADSRMVDLMWYDISAGQKSSSSGVPAIKFRHALSWLTFKVKAEVEGVFTVKSVILKGVKDKGSFSSNATAWSDLGTGMPDIVLYSDQNGKLVQVEASVLADDVLVIPQPFSASVLEIVYTLAGLEDAPQRQTLPVSGAESETSWSMGTHYTYTLSFRPNAIEILPSLPAEWSQGSQDVTVQ